MARDHALALTLPEGEAVLRLYQWAGPTVSFGRNEPTRGLYHRGPADVLGISFVRRPTGGRAVVHHRELTYAVLAPVGGLGGVREAFRRINQGLIRGMALLGAAASLASAQGRVAGPGAGPCFGAPAPGEVVAVGRKLVGSAQARMGRGLLQHGSILLADDQPVLARLRAREPARWGDADPRLDDPPRPATLQGLLGRVPSRNELVAAVIRGIREVLGGEWEEGPAWAGDPDREEELELHYRSEAWTWRR